MVIDEIPQFVRDFIHSLIPGYFMKSISRTLQRNGQPILGILVIGNIEPFSADIALTPRVVFVRPDPSDPVIVNQDFQSAVLGT
jgi:hypothetical protein